VIHIYEVRYLLAAAHNAPDSSLPPHPTSLWHHILEGASKHDITLLPLSFTENNSTHWLLLAIQFDTPTTPIVVLRNPLLTLHSAQALYSARRFLSPISSSILAFESRSRRQRLFSNDSGPLTFFNAAHICTAVEDDFSLPFPSFLRLRMALTVESFASSSSN
jgi:hypothetical protein